MAGLLSFVPGAGLLKVLEGVGIGLMVAGASTIGWGLLYFQPKGESIGAARVQAAWDAAELRRSAAAVQALEAKAVDEANQAALQREALDEAERLSARSRAAAARAADAGRVFVSAATTAAFAGSGFRASSAQAGASCQAAGSAAVLSAVVLGQVDQRLRDLAEFADASRTAGVACERSYDALTTRAELTVTSTAAD